MPAVFAFADLVLDDPQIAAFAAFGSFAMLVLADFGGPVRARLIAYVSLALTGAALIAIATACSRNASLAGRATAVASRQCALVVRWRTSSRLSSPMTARSSPRPPRGRERP